MNSHTKRAPIHGPVASILAGIVVFVLPLGALLSANSAQDLSATSAVIPFQGGSMVTGSEAGNKPLAATTQRDIGIGQFVPSVSEHWLSERLRDTLKWTSSPPAELDDAIRVPRPQGARPSRPAQALYLTFGVLQAADVYTTHVAVKGGARELNPMLRWAAKNPGALIAVKAASTVGTIYLLEKLRLRNRLAAVITTAAIDIYYAAIVVHNGTLRPSSN